MEVCLGFGCNRKNTSLSRNRHMYNDVVRYFIPFCCEQSCKKPFYTSHTHKPLTKRVAGWRKSRDRTSQASFPRLTFRPPLLSTVLPPRPVMVMGVTSTANFCQWKFYITLVTVFKTWGKASKPCSYSAANLPARHQLIQNAMPADVEARHTKWVILLQVVWVALCLSPRGERERLKF